MGGGFHGETGGAETGKDSLEERKEGPTEALLCGLREDKYKLKLSGLSLPVENRARDFSPRPLLRAFTSEYTEALSHVFNMYSFED